MKKLFALTMTVLMVMGLAACSGGESSSGRSEPSGSAPANSSSAVSADPQEAGSSSLPGKMPAQSEAFVEQEDVLAAAPPVQTALQEQTPGPDSEHTAALVAYFSWSGNTRTVAEKIQAQTGADIFEITTVNSYSDDYDTVLNEAQAEQRENARPELSGHVENMAGYDVVYLGYPNWWGDMPMALYSFLEAYDLSSKTIVPEPFPKKWTVKSSKKRNETQTYTHTQIRRYSGCIRHVQLGKISRLLPLFPWWGLLEFV